LDITERKLAENVKTQLIAQLEHERQRLRNIMANVPGIVWEELRSADSRGRFTNFISDYVETMFGYSMEEWLSAPDFWLTIVHPDDKERLQRAAAATFAPDKSGRIQFRFLAKDGRVVWTETHTIPILDDTGEIIGLRGVTVDISEQRQAEEETRKAEEKYRNIFENAIEGIFQSTPDGRFLAANPALAQILGYESPEDLIALRQNLNTQHYVNSECRQELKRLLDQDGFVLGMECEVFRKDGSKIWAIENARAICDDNGTPLYYEGSIEDITERKALQEQLQQAQKMEAIGRLAGGIAHDFNNLLTAINGYSELVLMNLQAEDPLLGYIEEIKKAGNRAAALTRQLLAFSRKQVLQPKILDLNSVVTDLEKMLRRLIGEDIDLRTVLHPELGSLKADPGQVEQVIMNLVVNARDAMPNGGKLIVETGNAYFDEEFVEQHIDITPGQYVSLAVTDTGIGMDEQTQKRIFEPFFTTKEMGKGTGLGLSTVYGIVKQSGGNLLVHSEIGCGTSFTIYLPRVDERSEEINGSAEVKDSLQGKETILLAEDEETVRKLAARVLEMYGYQVLVAANGGAAFLVCERHKEPIHLLISDVIMPEMGGRELANRLAQLHPEMKTLFMSGYTNDAIAEQGILEQGINFIQKPFTPSALARKVREILDK
jgi:PAS domain S-box-containing protein